MLLSIQNTSQYLIVACEVDQYIDIADEVKLRDWDFCVTYMGKIHIVGFLNEPSVLSIPGFSFSVSLTIISCFH